jgi:hypothetical protein
MIHFMLEDPRHKGVEVNKMKEARKLVRAPRISENKMHHETKVLQRPRGEQPTTEKRIRKSGNDLVSKMSYKQFGVARVMG